jgi:hypothetical protein
MPASTISSFCCALQLRYLRCSLNLVSLSVERPILSRPPAATIFPSDWTATASTFSSVKKRPPAFPLR